MRDSNIKIPIIAALVVAVVSLGVAFAAFSTQLNINGTATVQASSWDIYFTTAASGGSKPESSTNMPSGTITPSGSVSDATASILATTFTWSANFKSPNDKVVYTIYVKNGGDYNAKVSNITTPAITCTGDTKSACSHLHYGLFTDSTGETPLSTAFQVNAGATETFYLVAYLDNTYGGNDGSGLVSTDLTTDSISATVTFEQVGGATGGQSQQGGGSGSGSGGSQVASVEVYVPSYDSSVYNEETEEYDSEYVEEHWGTMEELESSLGNVTPVAYLKKQNSKILLCVNSNSTTQCYNEDDLENIESLVTSTCGSLGFDEENISDDYGCESSYGGACSSENLTIIGTHIGYGPDGEETSSEPYASRTIEVWYDKGYCNIYKEYSVENNQYELSQYVCSYYD
jgi:hypothetical protein